MGWGRSAFYIWQEFMEGWGALPRSVWALDMAPEVLHSQEPGNEQLDE
jgi:hypothetical protein